MLKICQDWEDRKIKERAMEMFKPRDYTKEVPQEKRQLDAFALLTNGDNICTAATIFDGELLISNNTNKEDELIRSYTDFFIDVIEKKEVNILEKKRLINLSYSKERERVKNSHWLGGVEKKLKALSEDPEKYLKGFYEKKELEVKSLEENVQKEEEKLNLLESDKDLDEESRSRIDVLQKRQEAECKIQKELVEEYKALQVSKKKGEDIEERKVEHDNKVKENRNNLKLIKDEIGLIRKTPEKIHLKQIIEKLKTKIDILNKNLKKLKNEKVDDVLKEMKKELEDEKILAQDDLEYKRGAKFLKRLKRAMERIVSGLLEGNSPFSLEMFKKLTFTAKKDVHAELCLIDHIWERVRATDKDFFSQEIYIGLNKLCCFKCMSTISQINEMVRNIKGYEESESHRLDFIQTRGAHQKSYGKWESPNIRNILDLKHPDQILLDLGISDDDFRTLTNNNYEDPDTSLSVIEIPSDEECNEEDGKVILQSI